MDHFRFGVPQKEGYCLIGMKGAGGDVAAGEAKTVIHIVACSVEHGGNIGAPDGSPPSGSVDGVEGRGVCGASGAQVPDLGEESEYSTGVSMDAAFVPNVFTLDGLFLVVEDKGCKLFAL